MKFKYCAPLRLDTLANRANVVVDTTLDGRYAIRLGSSKKLLKIVSTEREAKEYIRTLVSANVPSLDDTLPFPTLGVASAATAPPIQAQLTPLRRAIKSFQLFAAPIVPFKQVAMNIEAMKGFPVFSKIYTPLRSALHKVHVEFAAPRQNLEGKSFEKAIHSLHERALALDPEQRRLITIAPEFLTKEEVAKAGKFLPRDMTPEEISFAEMIPDEYVEDIPTIIRRNVLVDMFLRNRTRTLEQIIPQMQLAIREGRLPQTLQKDIDALITAAGDFKTEKDIYAALNLTDEEIYVSGIVRLMMANENINIPAVYRYAAAPRLKPEFKSGWEQFVAERGMSKDAEQLARERIDIIREAFLDKEYADRVVFGQLPVFRRFIDVGLWSGKQWGKAVSGLPERRALDVLNSLTEGSDLFSRRILSGHINPRELDPAISASKIVLGMLSRTYIDPLLPEAKKLTKILTHSVDDRLGKIVANFIHDVEGLPGGKFEVINSMFRTVARMAGINVDERIGERFINTLVWMSASATIPFRIGLLARNSMQSPMLTAPIIGGESWYAGLRVALGEGADGKFSIQNMKNAIERATKAEAIDPNVLPLHASEEIMGKRLPTVSKVGLKLSDLFDRGFSLYRTPDDLGRVIAFEGMRHRFFKHWGDFAKGLIDLDEFKARAKINTFDEVIIAQGTDLINRAKAGSISPDEAANYFGKHLADKTHFLYSRVDHPSGWGGVSGRLFGQFGTFPVQYLNYIIEAGTRGMGSKDWIEFITIHSGLNMGIVIAGDELFGADLQNWATFGSLAYTGGPYAEAALSLAQAFGGSDAERSLALRNLSMMFPTFSSPQSIFVPGSYFIGDFVEAFQASSFERGIGEAMGFSFLRPREDTWVDKAFGWIDEIEP